MSSLKTRLDRLEDKLKPDRKSGITVNYIGTDKELSKEEIKQLEAENISIIHVSFVD
jgi:hypothetical protein